MTEYCVGTKDEVIENQPVIVEIQGREIAVIEHDGDFYAYLNWCPHQAGPLFEGNFHGKWEAEFDKEDLQVNKRWIDDDVIINCPWHGWQFDISAGGKCLSRHDVELPSYSIEIDEDSVYVSV